MCWWGSLWAKTICAYYGVALVFTAFALILTCYYTTYARKQIALQMKSKNKESNDPFNNDCHELNEAETLVDEADVDTLQSRMKIAKHQAIINHLSANMTEEQLIEEKEVEKAQLAAIFNLLKEQNDKFQVSDMKELEDQLSLYR